MREKIGIAPATTGNVHLCSTTGPHAYVHEVNVFVVAVKCHRWRALHVAALCVGLFNSRPSSWTHPALFEEDESLFCVCVCVWPQSPHGRGGGGVQAREWDSSWWTGVKGHRVWCHVTQGGRRGWNWTFSGTTPAEPGGTLTSWWSEGKRGSCGRSNRCHRSSKHRTTGNSSRLLTAWERRREKKAQLLIPRDPLREDSLDPRIQSIHLHYQL